MDATSVLVAFLQPAEGWLLHSSVPQALQDIATICGSMRERRTLVLRLHARLQRVWRTELQHTPTPLALRNALPGLGVFGELLARLAITMRQYAGVDDPDFRLMISRQLLVKLQRLHDDILAMESLLVRGARARRDLRQSLERLQFEASVRLQTLLDKERAGYAEIVRAELERVEAELGELGNIREVLRRLRAEQVQAAAVVIKVDEPEDAAGGSRLVISKWEGVRRDVSRTHDEALVELCDRGGRDGRWLVRSHSTCHLCTPVVFAFSVQQMSSGSAFQQFVETRATELAALFYSVELSLHSSHEDELMNDTSHRDSSFQDSLAELEERLKLTPDTNARAMLLLLCPP